MSEILSVSMERGRARQKDLGQTWITAAVDLSSSAMLTTAGGQKGYLPVFRVLDQNSQQGSSFQTSLTDDGTLTFYLASDTPGEVQKQGTAAHPIFDGISFGLVLDASGAGKRVPLTGSAQGQMWTLTCHLAGDNLRLARQSLFDASPNVAIEINQPVNVAIQQTQAFIYQSWPIAGIRQGLLAAFGNIPFSTAADYYQMVSMSDPDFPNQYAVINCVYQSQISAPGLPGYLQIQVNWQGRAYNYYQDNSDRTRIFYLPDRFEFMKGPSGSPTISLLQFSMPSGDSSVSDTRATFRAFGNPIVDPARIENASHVIRDKIGANPQMSSVQDAHSPKMTFTQWLPNEKATGSNAVVQTKASIDLVSGLRNELDLNFDQFRALWAAIFSSEPENPLFTGIVDVELSGGNYRDQVAFNGRLPADKAESFFDDILDTSNKAAYSTAFRIKTFASVFQANNAICEIDVTIGGKTVALTANQLEANVTVERSIRDIVVKAQDPDQYPCRVRVVRDSGTTCCTLTASSDDPTVFLTTDVVSGCTGACV